MRRRRAQVPAGLLPSYAVARQPPRRNLSISRYVHADHTAEGVRLTPLTDYAFPCPTSRDPQWGAGSQYEVYRPTGAPYYDPYQGFTSVTPLTLPPGYIAGSYGYRYGPSTHFVGVHALPEGYDGFHPGVGGNINPMVGYNADFTREETGLGYAPEDPGSFPRCDANPGGPIHLTTNISEASHVSSLHLSQEVCRHSVWRAHWY